MSARGSVQSIRSRMLDPWLSAGMLCLAITGCRSVTFSGTGHSGTAPRSVPTQLVATMTTSTATKKPEAWQLQKSQREDAVRQATAESKSKGSVAQASFESELWKSDQPAPLMTSETSWCSECPLPDCSADCECPELCFGCDCQNALPTLWCDTKGVFNNWNNNLILAGAGGVAIWFREGDIDREVREKVAANPLRWGDGSQFLGKIGDVRFQAPVLLGLYGYSVWSQDEELHHVMGSLLSASVITGVSTSVLKLVTNTSRPSDTWMNGNYGFPSYHTSSTFAIAAVLDEYYGSKVGLPAYLLAGAVGFSRLDEQGHDLSDVVFGGTLGFVIGKAVAGRHLCGNSKIQLTPYFHPTDGTPGVAMETKF